ncbi:MAG: glutamate--cysteine ligase [Thiobacillaceae bacterium]
MGQEIGRTSFDASDFERFAVQLRQETARLLAWAQAGGFRDERRVAGFELEAWLLDHAGTPYPINETFLAVLADAMVVPELSRFNIEVNGTPQVLAPGALQALEEELGATWRRAQTVAHGMDAQLAIIGIPPTLQEGDLTLDTMSAMNRYVALNEQVIRQRAGQPLRIHIEGEQALDLGRSDVMLEAATTSFQLHLQVPERESARYYNASLLTCGPLLALAANSPLLFGRRLWQETRIPLFEQSVDLGGYGGLGDITARRVSLGRGYVHQTLLELYRENLDLFPVLLPMPMDEPAERFPHVRLHNGSIWRWVRPLIGFDAQGEAHVRIEQRVLPSGPTLLDMMANAAFYYGLAHALAHRQEALEHAIGFDAVRRNFYQAARYGLEARLMWLDGHIHPARSLLRELLPQAGEGLAELGLGTEEGERYIGILEARLETGQTGADWLVCHWHRCDDDLKQLMADYLENQRSGAPVHEWSP